jgi:hypothetical protein
MSIISQDNYTASWVLWPRESQSDFPIEVKIDRAFEGYLFYPEPEWSQFGYRPPENYPLIGAWRDSVGKVFIFLLDRSAECLENSPRQFVLYVTGDKEEADEIEGRIRSLKASLAKAEKKELQGKVAELRLDGEKKNKSIEKLMGFVVLFTVLVNGFSLYLRKLPPPPFPSESFAYFYMFLLSSVHFSALLLMIMIIIISIFYVLRYGFLLLRR